MNIARIAVLAAIACLAASSTSMAADPDGLVGRTAKRGDGGYNAPVAFNPDHQSTIRIRESDGLPVHKGIKLGRNKSTLVEMPRELRDVIVSNPEIMDAVVQSSNRVYLIGKKVGQSNAFFFDAKGQQIATLEVSIEHDTSVLEALFRRLIPGSNIKAEVLNETVILSGTVRAPADAARASSIASRFIVTPTSEANERHTAKVINMIAVEGEEQVMLQVVVAEMQRSIHEAVRHQHWCRDQYRQLCHGLHDGQRSAADVSGRIDPYGARRHGRDKADRPRLRRCVRRAHTRMSWAIPG